MSDFTPRQAARWIDQEFAKVDASNAAARAASERRAIAMANEHGLAAQMPNSIAAHEGLLARISKAFPSE